MVAGTQISTAEPISLNCLFPADKVALQGRRPFGKLSSQQRLSIAVTLAHTLLQLHESPWLCESWSKHDIHFVSRGIDRYNRPVIDDPFVSRSFGPQVHQNPGPLSPRDVDDFSSGLIINRSLFALGIILIELALNRPIEELCEEARPSNKSAKEEPPNIVEIYGVATNLIDAVYAEQGMQYGYVVQRCLKCEFGIQENMKDLSTDTFRALVCESVLAPLEDDLKRYSLG